MADSNSGLFKRNKYYPGKLLTAENFQLEQDYFIKKHEFINSRLYSGGVLRGLEVTASADGKSVNISQGTAIDYSGREIFVAEDANEPLKAGAADIEKGFTYLCLEYDWRELDKTFAPLLERGAQEQYDSVEDYYKFVWVNDIKDEFAEMDKLSGDDLYWKRGVLYSDADFIITQSVPLYVRPNRYFEFKTDVFRIGGNKKKLSFSYEMTAPNICTDEKTPKIRAAFSDNNHADSEEYNLTFRALAKMEISAAETLSITADSFKVSIDGVTKTVKPETAQWKTARADRELTSLLRGLYLQVKDTESFRLYLAKVYLNASGKVKDIKKLPFRQYLDSWRLNGILRGAEHSLTAGNEALTEAALMRHLEEFRAETRAFALNLLELIKKQPQMSSGRLTVTEFNRLTYGKARTELYERIPNAARDEKFRLINLLHICDRHPESEYVTEQDILELKPFANTFEIKNISHGLGSGSADVSCSVEENGVVSGVTPSAALSCVLDESNGTFSIKGRLLEGFTGKSLTVVWHASKRTADEELFIVPQATGAKIGEKVKLVCSAGGADVSGDSKCIWEAGPNADVSKGLFSSDVPGTYQVTAKYQNNKAEALVIVV